MGNARNLGSLLNTSTTIQADDLNIGQLGNRNKIINGAMQVAQRGTSATSVSASGYYTCDRWNYHKDGSEIITLSQESDAPADFKYSQKILVTTADIDIPVNSMMRLEQRIEASSLRDINQGTASAKQLNVSFWVKSNKTGSFSVGMFNDNNGATISQPYTINSADAWEHKTVTFVADTSVGTLSTTDNAVGLRLWFALASGTSFNSGTPNVWSTSATHRAIGQAVNLFDATNNYWQVTGVQLEAGDTATPFEHRSFGQELALCERYFAKSYNIDTAVAAVADVSAYWFRTIGTVDGRPVLLPAPQRGTPTVTIYNPATGGTGTARNKSRSTNDTVTPTEIGSSYFAVTTSGHAANGDFVGFHYTASAEL